MPMAGSMSHRALIQEGEIDRAKPFIEQALKIDSSLGSNSLFQGKLFRRPKVITMLR